MPVEQLISVTLNGKLVDGVVEARLSLVDFLREQADLTGVHIGCEHGVCGACTVLFDDQPIRSCLLFAIQADGHRITTIEGLTPSDGSLSPLQQAFCDCHGLQCGYCTPAMIVTAHALLRDNPDPDLDAIQEAIGGNLCRCTGYAQIIAAIQRAAKELRQNHSPPREPAEAKP